MSKKELCAYLAGIVDGEGYVGIKRSTWGMRNRPDIKSPTYSERVQIKMSNPHVVKMFQDEFGGGFSRDAKVYRSKNGFHTNKKMYIYRATDRVATKLLKAVLPYLHIKRRQAFLCLKLRKSKESKEARWRGGMKQKRTMSKNVLDKREKWYQQIKDIHSS